MESPESKPEGLEELRNRIRKQYPETQPQARSEARAWEEAKLDVKEASDEKELENELEVLRKEIIEKYPSAGDHPSKSEANPKVGKDTDGFGKDEIEHVSSGQHFQDSGVDSRDRDREHEENRSRVEGKLEPDLPGGHEIERANAPRARERQPRTDGTTRPVAPKSAARELVHDTPELHSKAAGNSLVPEEPDVKEVRERRVIESTLQGERTGRPSFAIRKDVVEDAIGEKMEKGKEYEIRVRIDGIGDVRTHHVEKGEDRIFISLPKEGQPENLRFGEKHRIEIYSVEERRDFNVIDTKEAGPTVKISRTSLESWGFQAGHTGLSEKRILDLEFRNTSRPEQPTNRYFAAYDGKREEMNLRLRKAGAGVGDVLRLEEKKEYRMDDFLHDFDKHKAEALKNVRLLMGKEGLQMEVDGRGFPLREPRLDAYGLRAILYAKIESTNRPIKITFDGERVAAKMSDDSPIIAIGSEHGLAIKYDLEEATRTFRLFDNFDARVLR